MHTIVRVVIQRMKYGISGNRLQQLLTMGRNKMIYSVGENIYAYNSGIEFSQVKRTKALTKAGISAKIITRKYSRFLARDTEAMGLTNSDYINMYDYFQQAQAFDRVENNAQILKTVPLSDYHIIHQNCN